MERFFGNRTITLYASGTAALAQAIASCAARSSASTPEAIIPAYGCPDLVAACVHACVYPRLVDVAPSRWSYDQQSLTSRLSRNTVAIVAVNLLGAGDGAAELVRLCNDRQIPLIQDSAQYLPRDTIDWAGDYIVLSFGRGKPLNLLRGGALIEPRGSCQVLSAPPADYSWKDHLLASRAAGIAFNILTRPRIYRIFSGLPGTGLGEVVYKPLDAAARLPEHTWEQVAPAFEQYRKRPSYRSDLWAPAVKEWTDFGIVALDGPGSRLPAEPLRLALLAPDRLARDALVDRLNRSGLGASPFYATDLTNVTAIPEMIKSQGDFPNARSLAGRLFTVPTHHLVDADTVRTARAVVQAWHRFRRIESARQAQAL